MKALLLVFLASLCFGTAQCQWTGTTDIYKTVTGGNVGIGTTTPLGKLHVSGAGTEIESILENTTDGYTKFSFTSNNKKWSLTKRNSSESDAFQLYHYNGTQWIFPAYMSFLTNGNLGVGTATPLGKLHISGAGSDVESILENTTDGNAKITFSSNTKMWSLTKRNSSEGNAFQLYFNNGTQWIFPAYMTFLPNGNMGIGTIAPGTNKLAVEGTIAARKVVVTMSASFPDYVFKKEYRLPSLSNVARYIRSNGHLPEMPTADSVQKNGLDLGSNQTLLVKKIEELTLYIIEQNKKNEEQSRELKTQRERIDRLERLMDERAKK